MGIKNSKYQVHPDLNCNNDNFCRICYMNDNNLEKFCDCKGSIEFMHRKCLLKWIKRSKSLNCEICNKKYNIKLTRKERKKINLILVRIRPRRRNSFLNYLWE